MSPIHPVVWLTTQPEPTLTADEGMWLAERVGFYEAPLKELHRIRTNEIESCTCGPPTQWRYGSKSERLEMKIDGREVTVTYAPEKDDVMRLTVNVPEDERLFRYVTWPHRPKLKVMRDTYRQPYVRLWYVYLGIISPNSITEVTPV